VWQNLGALLNTLLLALSAAAITAVGVATGLPASVRAATLQSTAAVERRLTSRVVVTLPADDAELVVNGETIAGNGVSREFETRPLDAGHEHRYTFTATWKPNTYTTITRSKTVALKAGVPVRVDLAVEDPGDRVRVIYVPTPADIAAAMVDLAGVGRDDVVFEPGCGDARITIAAIRKGARRGICVDIDDERARESRANVAAAGLADRIDVRHGDALDVKDLSDASVVLLYMGDHFDMMLRPILWRDLKVGSRIVSHRFTMGDWKPDKSLSIVGEDGISYQLHLWTITPEVKRRLNGR
jgi:uncharacterized protein (TIGR03000 family)